VESSIFKLTFWLFNNILNLIQCQRIIIFKEKMFFIEGLNLK